MRSRSPFILEDESPEALRARIAQLEASLASTTTALSRVTAERDKLRRAYEQLKEHLELLRRRIFVAKAERVDVAQLEVYWPGVNVTGVG